MMDTCRTCLKTPADRTISQLKQGIKDIKIKCMDIMLFCLDIKITEDSKITTNLCNNCYRKIILFYKFKALSLKNDAYLKSLEPNTQLTNEKLTVYEDENGVKHENLLETDEYGPCLVEWDTEIKQEINVKSVKTESTLKLNGEETVECLKDEDIQDDAVFDKCSSSFDGEETLIDDQTHHKDVNILENVSDEEPLSVVQQFKHENISNRRKENAPKRKKSCIRNKKSSNVKNGILGWPICEECGASVLDLPAHMLTHQPRDNLERVRCKVCPKTFKSKTGRRRHYKTTHLGVRAKCDICEKEVVHLASHKLQIHNPSALPLGCSMCERRFISKTTLELHMTSHTSQEAQLECDICHKKFQAKVYLTQHIRQVHHRERSRHCHLCPKAYFSSTELKEHLRTHTQERSYLCPECGKSYMTKNCLRIHRTTHSDVKLLKCEVCDKSFRIASVLKVHMVTHTKEKPYPCQYCGKRFGRSSNCRRHEAGHQKCATPTD